MIPYAESRCSEEALATLSWAAQAIPRLPDHPELRCHELARAVASAIDELGLAPVVVVDGHCGAVEHSWLRVAEQPEKGGFALLDVYAPGCLPQVILLDTWQPLPWPRAYKAGADRRMASTESEVAQGYRLAASWRGRAYKIPSLPTCDEIYRTDIDEMLVSQLTAELLAHKVCS